MLHNTTIILLRAKLANVVGGGAFALPISRPVFGAPLSGARSACRAGPFPARADKRAEQVRAASRAEELATKICR